MNEEEREALRELADCQGTVCNNQYSPKERRHMKSLEEQGLVMLAWTLTAKGRAEVDKVVSKIACLCLFFFAVSVASAQPTPLPFPQPKGLLPAKIAAKAGKPVLLDASAAKGKIKWRLDFDPTLAVIDGKKLAFASPYNGTYKVLLISFDDGQDSECEITVTGGSPMPPPDDPPTPPEDPAAAMSKLTKAIADLGKMVAASSASTDAKLAKMEARIAALEAPRPPPPDPKPVDPAPIPLPGFRVLIVYDPATLTDSQKTIVYGKKFRDYLQAKCVVGADGKTKDFWIIQAGLDVSAAPKWIGDAIQRHPGQRSFMVVSDGKTGYDGVLPTSVDEALPVLQKIGGQ